MNSDGCLHIHVDSPSFIYNFKLKKKNKNMTLIKFRIDFKIPFIACKAGYGLPIFHNCSSHVLQQTCLLDTNLPYNIPNIKPPAPSTGSSLRSILFMFLYVHCVSLVFIWDFWLVLLYLRSLVNTYTILIWDDALFWLLADFSLKKDKVIHWHQQTAGPLSQTRGCFNPNTDINPRHLLH